MPVKTIVEAIFGETVVFRLEGLCRAEELMVTITDILHCNSSFSLFTVFKFNRSVFVLNIRYKYDPRWIHAIVLQKRNWFCWSQRTSGSFSGINSIKWGNNLDLWASVMLFQLLWTILTIQPLRSVPLSCCLHWSLCIYCHFRLCNMAIWPESDEHLCQHADGQQEQPGSAASPPRAHHPRATWLVCQIWTPLVASLELRSDLRS